MIGEHARFYARGGWGQVRRAFVYDLTKGALIKGRMDGLRRYGKAPGSADDDTRPLGLIYDIEWLSGIVGTELSPLVEGAALTPLGSVFGNLEGFSHGRSTANNPVSFRSSFNIVQNGGWSIRCFIHSYPKAQLIKLQQWFWGAPGRGFVFQIRGGTAEIAGLSKEYNDADMMTLRELWSLEGPTDEERASLNALQKKLFVDFESLSFERSTGRGDWVGQEWTLSFIAESRGVLHIVAEGLDATAHEVTAILKTRLPGVLWEDSPLTLWSGGGAFFFSLGKPLFREKANIFYGPIKTAYFSEYLDELTYAQNVYAGTGHSVVMSKAEIDVIRFGFNVDVTNENRYTTPWIYGLSARIAPGDRNGSQTISFDTDDLYIPTVPAVERDTGDKILEIVPSWGDSMNRRTYQITMRDVHGMTSSPHPLPVERVGTLELGGEPLLKNGLVLPLKQSDMASLAKVRSFEASRFETDLNLTLADGWEILNQMNLDPPPIGDNLTLGEFTKEHLRAAGFSDAQMAGVPNTGKRVSQAAFGEDWAARVDGKTKIGDALRSLWQAYGLGQRLYHDNNDVWRMVAVSNAVQGVFSSTRVPLPHAEPGRLTILTPIDILHDSSNFYNHILVEGGENGEIVGEWIDWESVNNPDWPTYIGRVKTLNICNTGLRTQSDVNYCLRSAREQSGRGGRRAQFSTYFHNRFWPGARIECDGGVWEIEGISGGSWAKDEMQYNVLEIATP